MDFIYLTTLGTFSVFISAINTTISISQGSTYYVTRRICCDITRPYMLRQTAKFKVYSNLRQEIVLKDLLFLLFLIKFLFVFIFQDHAVDKFVKLN